MKQLFLKSLTYSCSFLRVNWLVTIASSIKRWISNAFNFKFHLISFLRGELFGGWGEGKSIFRAVDGAF